MSLYNQWCSSSSYIQYDYIPVPVSQYTNGVHNYGQPGLKHQRFSKQPWPGEIFLKKYKFKVLKIAYRD